MKKVTLLLITIVLCFSICGCGITTVKQSKKNQTNDTNKEYETQESVKKDETKGITLGDKISTNDFDFTLNNVELTYTVNPEDTSSVYSSYDADSGKIFVHVDGSYYNKSKKDICVRDLFAPTVEYDDGYSYEGFVAVDDGNSFTWAQSYIVCNPLATCHYHGIIECPEVVSQSNAPLKVLITINGTKYEYSIR